MNKIKQREKMYIERIASKNQRLAWLIHAIESFFSFSFRFFLSLSLSLFLSLFHNWWWKFCCVFCVWLFRTEHYYIDNIIENIYIIYNLPYFRFSLINLSLFLKQTQTKINDKIQVIWRILYHKLYIRFVVKWLTEFCYNVTFCPSWKKKWQCRICIRIQICDTNFQILRAIYY